MTIEIVVPEPYAKDHTTKDLVFSILIEDHPKTLTQLHRQLKKQYGKSVSFQAVIKAVRSLIEHGVIIKKDRLYTIDKDWIFEARNFFDRVYSEYFKVKRPMRKTKLSKDVTIYTVSNLLELDRLWNDILTNWAKKEKKDKRNVWNGKHCWWLIPRLQEEDILHDLFAKRNVKTYNLITSDSPLDKICVKYYTDKKEFCKINTKTKVKDQHISAFGDNILKFEIPTPISKKLEDTYKKCKKLSDLNLKKVLEIFKTHSPIEIALIKDQMLSNNVKEEIIQDFL